MKRIAIVLMPVLVRSLVLALALLAACGASSQTRTRTALDVIGRAVDAAGDASVAACDAQQKSVIRSSASGSIDPARAWAELNEIADRCFDAHAAFGVVKRLHDQAVELLESGKVEQARAVLEQLQGAWTKLRESGGELINPWAGGAQ